MITITPMIPPRDEAAHRYSSYANPPMRTILAAAWICAAISLSGLVYGGMLKLQEYRAPVMTVACP